jgi:hypothetical protein
MESVMYEIIKIDIPVHAAKVYEWEETLLQPLLTSALGGNEWSDHVPASLYPWKQLLYH